MKISFIKTKIGTRLCNLKIHPKVKCKHSKNVKEILRKSLGQYLSRNMFAKPHELKQIVLQINNIYILWQYVEYVLSLDLPLNI